MKQTNHSVKLETKIYPDNRITLYCGALFDADKDINPPTGFHTDKYKAL